MRPLLIITVISIFLLVAWPAKAAGEEYYYNHFDHQVLKNLYDEVMELDGNLMMLDPLFYGEEVTGCEFSLERPSGKELNIKGVSFNGLDAMDKTKIKQEKTTIKVVFKQKTKIRPGYHYLLVKYEHFGGTCGIIIPFIVETAQSQREELSVDKRVLVILGNLHKNQQKLTSYSAQLKGALKNYDTETGETIMEFTGQYNALWHNRFNLTLAAPPEYKNRREGKTSFSRDKSWEKRFPARTVFVRNRLGAYNLIFYTDYLAIMDGYSWQISYEDKNEVWLEGLAAQLSQKPYRYLIRANKNNSYPVGIQTFLDGKQVIGWATATYKKTKGLSVPIHQDTSIKFSDRMAHEYMLDLSTKIIINKFQEERKGDI